MSKHLISRIIMMPDATVHIAFFDRSTIGCTVDSLSAILASPISIDIKPEKRINTTPKTNPLYCELEKIPGLTLAEIYSDAQIICIFPDLFRKLFSAFSTNEDSILDLTDFINSIELNDEKQLLLKFFYRFTNDIDSSLTVKTAIDIDLVEKIRIITETYNSSFLPFLPLEKTSTDSMGTESDTPLTPAIEERFYTVPETSIATGYCQSTLYNYISNKKYPWVTRNGLEGFLASTVEKIKADKQKKKEKRAARTKPKTTAKKANELLNIVKEAAYETMQKRLLNEGVVGPEVARFIFTGEEYQFYRNHGYKEVSWESRRGLIIDVHPEYFSKEYGLTNQELMARGDAPVVPDYLREPDDPSLHSEVVERESLPKYIIHHIGQDIHSPFAVILPQHHTKYYSLLHKIRSHLAYEITPSGDYIQKTKDDLHGPEFKIQKVAFWKDYNEAYIKAMSFDQIPGKSLAHTGKKGKK